MRQGRGFAEVGVSASTVSPILKRLGLSRVAALEPADPVRRYERAARGEILHIDISMLYSVALTRATAIS
jgi:hypothetical protein